MKPALENRLQVLANAAIVLVAILTVLALLAKRDPPKNRTEPSAVGTTLDLPVNWSANKRTLVLALRTDCRYCTESTHFYRSLRTKQEASEASPKLVAVFPQSVEEARAYLSSHGIKLDQVLHGSLSKMGVQGTPTLMLTDEQGKVTKVWRGKLRTRGEDEVFEHF